MTRDQGWEMRFAAYLRAKQDEPFEWGKNDCVLFAVKALEVITGINFYEKYLPYGSQDDAAAIMTRWGGIEGLVARDLGDGHANHRLAHRGDLALVQISQNVPGYVNGGVRWVNAPDFTLGIVDDSGMRIATVGPHGLVRVPLRKAVRIWSY